MTIQKNKIHFSSLAILLIVIEYSSCTPDLRDDTIPFLPFSPLVLNLNLPENTSLRTDGGYKIINSRDGGVQGIILYRIDAITYRAYERNCSYRPNEACVTVEVHSSNLYMVDNCCASTFDFQNGTPTGGPAWRPLRQYQTSLSNSTLTVTDEIVE